MSPPEAADADSPRLYDKGWPDWADMKRYGPASQWLRTMISDLCRLSCFFPPPGLILDVGCGEGSHTRLLAEAFPSAEVKGIDFSRPAVEAARRLHDRPNLRFEHVPASSALKRASCDLVSAFEVLEHVTDWQGLLGQMAGASRKFILLSFPTGRMRRFEKDMGHLRNFRKGEVEGFLDGAGFGPLFLYRAGFPWYNPLYRDLCDWFGIGRGAAALGTYGPGRKLLSELLFIAFRYFSTRRRFGDKFCGLFARKSP